METLWRLAARDPAGEAVLTRDAGVSPLTAALLVARGIRDRESAGEFFRPDPARLFDPFLLRGAAEAADLLVHSSRRGRRVVVFGDYDVDGVTAAAQLRAALLRAGADAVAFLPHRLRDGYGLKPDTVRRVLREHRPAVIVTVDCGITSVEGVACARAAGVEVIVTDHHLLPDLLPRGAIVVNPKQPGCLSPTKDLAAAGIALKLAEAVARRGSFPLSRESLLRVACLGTIADLVPLTGENRVIAAAGLAALASPRAPGLAALLEEAGIEPGRAPSAEEVAYRLAPRLNAAGRLDTADLALCLLEERDPVRARRIARQLTLRNAERQALERRVAAEARERVLRGYDLDREAVIIEGDTAWHRGVLGIVASRLAREFHRPVLLFGFHEERASGSGRSIPGVDLHHEMKALSEFFAEFGGHEQAVGGSLPASRFEELREATRSHLARGIAPDLLRRVEQAEWELPVDAVTEELAAELEAFEPHGSANPRPVFACSRTTPDGPPSALGERGLRLRLRRSSGPPLTALCWSPGSLPSAVGAGESFAMHYRLRRGRGRPVEAEVLAVKPAGATP